MHLRVRFSYAGTYIVLIWSLRTYLFLRDIRSFKKYIVTLSAEKKMI